MPPTRHILVLGAGELGSAIIDSLLSHPAYDRTTTTLTLAIRAETLHLVPDTPTSSTTNITHSTTRLNYLSTLHFQHNITLVAIDLSAASLSTLIDQFTPYTTIIHAGGMDLPRGTQLKLTRAVLAANCAEYIPWQWGVDYDAIGPKGGMGLFAEQCQVRDLLRSPTQNIGTKWLIVSCGVFMSFLFEEFWGVVVRKSPQATPGNSRTRITGIRALGGWNHNFTATTARDVARCSAELVLADPSTKDQVVYIAGDTMTYRAFADLVERVVGREVMREVWTTEWLKEQAEKATDEEERKLLKYRVVFSEDVGLSWPKDSGMYNAVKGIEMDGVEGWMRRNCLE